MKRFFFPVLAFAAIAVGCTKSGVVDLPQSLQTPIEFEPYSGKAPITKAEIADLTTIQAEGSGIHVTGYVEGADNAIPASASVYMDKDVTYSATNTKWGYEGASYWPETGTLSFVAYGLNAGNHFQPTTTGSKTNFTFTVPEDVTEQVDLLVSPRIKGQSIAKPTVSVRLYHLLSRVSFAVQTNNLATEDAVKVLIKNVTLNGSFVNKGTVDLTADHMKDPNNAEDEGYLCIEPSATSDDVTTVYSLFDSEYDGTNPSGDFPGFMTGNTKAADGTNTPVDIYKSMTFTAGGDYPAFTTPGTAEDHYMMIMPGQVGNIDGKAPYIEVIYQLTDADEQVAKIPLTMVGENDVESNWIFEAGKAYRFVFTVSTTAIGFTVEVDPWEELANSTHTLVPEA